MVDERKREGGEERIAGSEARIIVIGSLVVPSQLAVVGIRRLDTVGFGCQLPIATVICGDWKQLQTEKEFLNFKA